MKRLLFRTLESIRASYWFVPSVMAFGAVVLAFGLVYVDGLVGESWTEEFSWLYANKAAGAREVLSTIAGSMITVAGVTFSITIAAVAYATSQFGPRLLSNFMRDRGNQFTLGTFIATFLYCLLVLRTIRAADEQAQDANAPDVVGAFVPHIAMLVALLLAVASIGVLIYFIHHVPEQIHAGRVVARIGRELMHGLERLFPEQAGWAAAAAPDVIARQDAEALPLAAHHSGYVQYVDVGALIEAARAHDAVLFVRTVPGDFAHLSLPLAAVWPPSCGSADLERRVQQAFAFGEVRTPVQDLRFLVDELAEISARALSPGVNDPFTAMNCAEWLTSAAVQLAQRPAPSPYRYDEDGQLRLVAAPVDFATLLRRAFDGTRPYVAPDRNAALHQMKCLLRIGEAITRMEDGRLLAALARRFHAEARPHLHADEDVRELDARLHALLQTLGAREAVPV